MPDDNGKPRPPKGLEISTLKRGGSDLLARRRAILSGRHPDTGQQLQMRDGGTLRGEDRLAFEEWRGRRAIDALRQQTDGGIARKIEEIQKRNAALISWPDAGQLQRSLEVEMAALRAINPLDQKVLKALDPAEQIRRHLSPLRDADFVQRMIVGREPRWAASSLKSVLPSQEDLASRQRLLAAVNQHDFINGVYNAADQRIRDYLKGQGLAERDRLRSAYPFDDPGTVAREAQRILTVYGPTIAEQSLFLSQFRVNLAMFPGLGQRGIEQAELLARSYLPSDLYRRWDAYSAASRRHVRKYWQSAIRALKKDFVREQNPVHAWEAVSIAFRESVPWAPWLREFLGAAADRIVDILDDVSAGAPAGKEAERVGKALGFGVRGPGRGGWFGQASTLQRDRIFVSDVEEWISSEETARPGARAKLTSAYAAIAAKHGVGISVVRDAMSRIQGLRKP